MTATHAQENAGQPAPRVIKRYANRKMYDTERSCYVTLEEIAELVRGGVDVQVVDNSTKADLTEVTLAQALLDSQRKHRQPVSLSGLRTLISQGGDLLTRNFPEVVRARTDVERTVERTVEKWRTEAERTVGRVLQRSRDEGGLGLDQELADAIADTTGAPVPEGVAMAPAADGTASQPVNLDERLRRVAEALGVANRRHDAGLTTIERRLDAIEARLQALEAVVAPIPRPAVSGPVSAPSRRAPRKG